MAKVRHNVKQFTAELTALEQECSIQGVAPVVRGKIIRLFKKIVENTPQWSGAAASNWRIYGGGQERPSGYDVSSVPLFSKGMEPAVGEAYANNAAINNAGEEIFSGVRITNPQPIISFLEGGSAGSRPLRDVNRPGGMVAKAIAEESGRERLTWVQHVLSKERL
jgi:hypothetical protein